MIHSLRAAGTTFDCRQQRIAAMPDSAPVYFKAEPGNTYDPLAIAIVNEAGEHLGYIPQYADRDRRILNRQREQIRTALANGFVVARAAKTGGFTKRDGTRASYGLLVQYYAVSSMYGFRAGEKDEDEEAVVSRKRGNSAQAPKRRGNEWKDRVKRHHKGRYTYQQIMELKKEA